VDVNIFDLGRKLVMLLCNDINSLLIVTSDGRCTMELEIDAAKNRIHSSICKAVRESKSSLDSVVNFVTVRCTVDSQSIISPPNLNT
jgi:hypothetical protein